MRFRKISQGSLWTFQQRILQSVLNSGLWENCVRFQGAQFEGDWGVIVLCTMFPVSCIFFNKCLFFLLCGWILSGQTIYAYTIYVYTRVYVCGDCKYRYMQTHIYTHDHMYYTGVYTHPCVCMCITSSTASPAYVPCLSLGKILTFSNPPSPGLLICKMGILIAPLEGCYEIKWYNPGSGFRPVQQRKPALSLWRDEWPE